MRTKALLRDHLKKLNVNVLKSPPVKSVPFSYNFNSLFARMRRIQDFSGKGLRPRTQISKAEDQSIDSISIQNLPIQQQLGSNTTSSSSNRQNELALICNELDKFGNLQAKCGRFLKSSLCASLGLQPRDLRKLDGTFKNQLPSILVRPAALLINFEYIKAVVKCDGVILFEGIDLAERLRQHSFLLELQAKLKAGQVTATGQPFEFVVLESILQTIIQALQDEFEAMLPTIEDHLTGLEKFVHWDKLKIMLECKKRVSSFQERVNNLRQCLSEVLESDADMAEMYLTAKSSAPTAPRPTSAHEEVELLLESYMKIVEEIASRVQLLATNIQSTEDIVNIGLVGQRNELLLLELKLGIGTFAASMGGFGASVLGMNLKNGFEGDPSAFYIVLGALLSTAAGAFVFSWRRMRTLIRKY